MRVILPGSYDPVTLGHLEIIRRAATEHEEVYVVIFVNPDKEYTFSLDDRMRMLMLATDEFDNVLVSNSAGLVIDYLRDHDIEKIIKGYRNDVDLEYERRQAEWNKKFGGYETELILASEEYRNISSTLARDSIRDGADLTAVLPESVISYLRERDK